MAGKDTKIPPIGLEIKEKMGKFEEILVFNELKYRSWH